MSEIAETFSIVYVTVFRLFIYLMYENTGAVVNDVLFTYTTYNITKKVFFTCYGEKFTSCCLCQILLSEFWNFYTKPIILMS